MLFMVTREIGENVYVEKRGLESDLRNVVRGKRSVFGIYRMLFRDIPTRILDRSECIFSSEMQMVD